MTPLRFTAARLLRNEEMLTTLSVQKNQLLEELNGKSVALVGNARALSSDHRGSEIDAHDIVARINLAPTPSPDSHGIRTDWLGLATRLHKDDRKRINPRRILWMSHKRKRLDYRSAHSPGFYLHALSDYRELATKIGAPPTTGAMMIDLFLRAELTRLDLYGFDFFASRSLSGRRTAEQVPHDFAQEADWVTRLVQTDTRLHLYRPG